MEVDNSQECVPMTSDQLRLLARAMRLVMDSPDGTGEVTITINKGFVRFIRPTPSLDMGRPEEALRWDRLDKTERQFSRTR